MCQCLVCDCWWVNMCGVPCAGLHNAICICSYWLCRPADLQLMDPVCCKICGCDGWGGNCCCWGGVCCAAEVVKQWSRMRSSGGQREVVVVVQTNGNQGYGNQGYNNYG